MSYIKYAKKLLNSFEINQDTKKVKHFNKYGKTFYYQPSKKLSIGFFFVSNLKNTDDNTHLEAKEDSKTCSDQQLRQLISESAFSVLIKKVQDSDEKVDLFEIDLDSMGSYPLREGFGRYGGRLLFNINFNVNCIDYMGKIYRPGEKEWDKIKGIFISSMFVFFIIKYIIAGRLHFGLKEMTVIHEVLLRRNHLLHRLFAFTICGLNEFISDSVRSFELKVPLELESEFLKGIREKSDLELYKSINLSDEILNYLKEPNFVRPKIYLDDKATVQGYQLYVLFGEILQKYFK